jgi:hypothetical protein
MNFSDKSNNTTHTKMYKKSRVNLKMIFVLSYIGFGWMRMDLKISQNGTGSDIVGSEKIYKNIFHSLIIFM